METNIRRRLRLCVLAIALAAGACHGKHEKVYLEDDEKETATQSVSAFKMNEPPAARQLMTGFYGVESGSWRWTARDFVVSFKTPPEAGRRGAAVSFDFVVPDIAIQNHSTMTLAAAIHGKQIGSQEYSKPGSYTFTAEAPPELCANPETIVDFHLDKTIPPSPGDERELGVIATAAALRTK